MECVAGLEPATPSLENWCSSQLSYTHKRAGVRRAAVPPVTFAVSTGPLPLRAEPCFPSPSGRHPHVDTC